MSATQISYSDDQAQAYDTICDILRSVGIDLENSVLTPAREGKTSIAAVIGKAGSGKTLLLAELYNALKEAGMNIVSGDYEARSRKERRTLAILAPTNRAASVLRNRGVPATTIHRIVYTPMYEPEYEKIAEWLGGNGPRPEIGGVTDISLDREHDNYASKA